MKILIVDDNPIDIELVKRKLHPPEGDQHEISEANSVAEGLKLIIATQFDVVLLDYHMPECNGIELLIELRSRPHLGDTAIIIVSASKDVSVAMSCIEAGAQDFLPKNELTQIKLLQAIIHSRKRFELEQKMHQSYLSAKDMAEKDALTGVFNRYYFDENLSLMMLNAKRANQFLGLLIIDLDNFKNVNDSLGHDVGDGLLKALVERVTTCLRANDCFARLGGDEFAVVLGNINDVNQINQIALRILDSFKPHFALLGNRVFVTPSIGGVIYPNDTEESSQLLKCADIALYRAKQQGKNTICFFESHYQVEFNRRFSIQSDMTSIIQRQGFRLFHQPIYYTSNNKIDGVEVLIRWPESPVSYTPDEFIPIAEESRQIGEIGRWVIDTALKQLAELQHIVPDLKLSINISPKQLNDSTLCQYLLDACHSNSVSPRNLTLELTETALVEQNGNAHEIINALHDKGFTIALDDFGMGFSSISHLTNYPIGLVKLDRSMLWESGKESEKKKAVYEAVLLMLQRLDLPIIAEGIEHQHQVDYCQSHNIERLQGYFLGRPMPFEDFVTLIKNST